MNLSNIKLWFDFSLKTGQNIQNSILIDKEKPDVNSIWKNIEILVLNINIHDMQFNSNIFENINININNNEYLSNINNIINSNNNSITNLSNILKIAFEIGQLNFIEKYNNYANYDKDILNKFSNLDTYINIKNQDLINELYLDNKDGLDKLRENIHQLGGNYNYYNKYIKYKIKYLKLKNKKKNKK